MQRILSTAVLVGLLVATAAAFAITERLKLTKSPISGPKISAALSPLAHTKADISVRFRHPDQVTVTIADGHRRAVATLAGALDVTRGRHRFVWNGRTDSGRRAPDGTYRVQIHLARQHRTILIPDPILLDTTTPDVRDAAVVRRQFSPDGDHQADTVTLRYALSKQAHVLVFVDGRRIIRGRSHRTTGKVQWNGKVRTSSGALRLLPPGTYVLRVGAEDVAGNRALPANEARVRVVLRYITLANNRLTGVKPRTRFQIGVSTDAKRYRWQLGARKGFAGGPVLTVRAPKAPGRYRLTVSEHGHVDRALVVVR